MTMEQSAAMLKEASNEELLRQLVFLDYGWNTEYVNLIKTEVLSRMGKHDGANRTNARPLKQGAGCNATNRHLSQRT